MKIVEKAIRLMTDKDYRFLLRALNGYYQHMDDREYLLRMFKARMGKALDLDNPLTYNEKTQWLKLYDRQPRYTQMVDKLEVKSLVSKAIGAQYVIPTLKVWNRSEDITLDELPNRFVLKCTHDSHDIVICKDKESLDRDEVIRRFTHGLRQNYYTRYREWPYKYVKPRVIAEPYLEEPEIGELRDYKLYCFDGKVRLIMIAQGRFAGKASMDYFDTEYHHLDINWGKPNAELTPQIPDNIEEMIRLAEKLGQGIPSVRVDLYNISGNILFGEFTFYDGSGLQRITPESWDKTIGDWIHLPQMSI